MIAMRLAPLLAFGSMIACAHAQPADEFYKQKQIRIIVGFTVGGDYDLATRLLAKYLGRHIAGHPVVIVQNMPGAASVVATNFLFNRAPQDGTVFGTFSRNLPSQAVLGQNGVQVDLRRFIWIGGTSQPSHRVCVAWHSKQVKTADDLFQRELIVAGGSSGSTPSMIPTVLNNVLGTKFRVVEGYPGMRDASIALERGEVEGLCRSLSQFTGMENNIRNREIRILLHLGESPMAEYPDVPSAFHYAKRPEQRQMLHFIFSSDRFVRPYVFPPNVPPDRIAIMRRTLVDTLKDPDLMAEAAKSGTDMSYQPSDGLSALVEELYSASPDLMERVKTLVPILK